MTDWGPWEETWKLSTLFYSSISCWNIVWAVFSDTRKTGIPVLGWGFPEFVFKLSKRTLWRISEPLSGRDYPQCTHDQALECRICQDFLQNHQKRTTHYKVSSGPGQALHGGGCRMTAKHMKGTSTSQWPEKHNSQPFPPVRPRESRWFPMSGKSGNNLDWGTGLFWNLFRLWLMRIFFLMIWLVWETISV